MIMNEMKTNNSKRLIAAVAILAMVVCAFAVALPASDATTSGPIDFDGTVYGYDSSGETNGYDGSETPITNAGLGNNLQVVWNESNKTYTVTGTVMVQDIAYNGTTWSGTNTSDSAKGFYSNYVGYETAGEDYAIVMKASSDVRITTTADLDGTDATNATLPGSPTRIILSARSAGLMCMWKAEPSGLIISSDASKYSFIFIGLSL